MNVNFLRTFVNVIENNSISKAAKTLNITQPAASKQISALEEYYGIKFLERLGRKMVPTEAGNKLYHHAKIILANLQQLEEEMNELVSEVQGRLIIGASTTPGQYILPKIIGAFKKEYPQVKIFLEVTDSGKVVQKLLEHKIHLGAVGTKVNQDKVASVKLAGDELVLITPPAHPFAARPVVRASELAGENLVWRESDSGTRQEIEAKLAKAGLNIDNLEIIAEFESTESIISAVETGMGISFVSRWAVQKKAGEQSLACLNLKDITLERNLYVIYPKRKYFNRAAQAFVNFLRTLNIEDFLK